MSNLNFGDVFSTAMGDSLSPYAYQCRLACGPGANPENIDSLRHGTPCRSQLINVPTGLGKTAAVVLAWLWNRVLHPDSSHRNCWPRRLVYCLPMRTLVEQTRDAAKTWLQHLVKQFAQDAKTEENELAWLAANSPAILMGGEAVDAVHAQWDIWPEKPALLIGTQDMLLSRALNRGYRMSRYRWPMHFGFLNNDCLWVMDETQLMGPALWTSSQLDWMRTERFKSLNPCFTWWMSATIRPVFFGTLDRRNAKLEPPQEVSLGHDAKAAYVLTARRPCARWPAPTPLQTRREGSESIDAVQAFLYALSAAVIAEHESGSLTLVICNTVAIAQSIYTLVGQIHQGTDEVILLTSRFRPMDRKANEMKLIAFEQSRKRSPKGTHTSGLVCVCTQVIEAGVDISARRLWSEIAPWTSIIQRLGRLNRDGSSNDDAKAWFWKLPAAKIGGKAPSHSDPYTPEALKRGEELLAALASVYDDDPELGAADALRWLAENPSTASKIESALTPPPEPFPRAFDIHGLFSTEPDIFGGFTDVSPFVRDQDQNADVTVFWRRDWEERAVLSKDEELGGPPFQHDEGCPVPVYRLMQFVGDKHKPWIWDDKGQAWHAVAAAQIRPGMLVMLPASTGGYDPRLGWTGDAQDKLGTLPPPGLPFERFDDDRFTQNGYWVELKDHLVDTEREAKTIVESLQLSNTFRESVINAARQHDIGKSLRQWQTALPHPVPNESCMWAKGPYVLALSAEISKKCFDPENVETLLRESGLRFRRCEPWWEGTKSHRTYRWQTDSKINAIVHDRIADMPGQPRAWNGQFRPGLRHEVGSALALWHVYYRNGKAAFPALTIYLVAAHHGKARTVLSARTPDGEDVCGVLRTVTNLPWDNLQLDFTCAADGAAGHFSEDGTQFICEAPGWTGLVCDILGNWEEGTASQPTCGAVPENEPSGFGPFALAYLESLVRCADERASQRPEHKVLIGD